MARKRKAPASEPEPEPEQLQPQDEPQDEPESDQQQIEEFHQQQIQEQEYEDPDMDDGGNEDEEDDDDGEEAEETKDPNGADKEEGHEVGVHQEAEEEFEDEPVEKLLEPFSKDQLCLLIKEAVAKHPDLMKSVNALADADPAHRKIFIHGLGWDTTAETLVSEFSKYGEVEDCKAVTDKISGKSKGYAFILFKHRIGAKKALVQPQKKIGNRLTSCQLASAGPVPAPPPTAPPVSEYTQRKIFISNVAAELDPQKLLEFFSQYGEIVEGPLGLDKQTGKPKGFCLFVYKSVDSAKKALEEPHKAFEGVTLHVYKAVDGPKPTKSFHQPHHNPHHHQQQFHPHSSKKIKGKYPPRGSGGAAPGNAMAPPGPAAGFNPAAAALAPALGQALTTLLAGQGAGLGGINNLLGGLGAAANQGVPPMGNNPGYGVQPAGGYGNQPGMQGGYQNPQMGQGAGRPQMGGAPFMGHGH